MQSPRASADRSRPRVVTKMPTEAQFEKWIGWISLPTTRIPDQDLLAAYLQDQLERAREPIIFAPLECGGWCVDGRYYRGICPKGLGLAWQAVCAFQSGVASPLVEAGRSHAVGKSIKTDAIKWAKSRCRRLVCVLECISIASGSVIYDPRPGVPKIITRSECLSGAFVVRPERPDHNRANTSKEVPHAASKSIR